MCCSRGSSLYDLWCAKFVFQALLGSPWHRSRGTVTLLRLARLTPMRVGESCEARHFALQSDVAGGFAGGARPQAVHMELANELEDLGVAHDESVFLAWCWPETLPR